MKKIIFCTLLISGLVARSEDSPRPVTAPPAATASSPGDDLAGYKTEDDLWKHLSEAASKMETLQQGDEAVAEKLNLQIMAGSKAYLEQYPKGAHVVDVKMMRVQSGGLMIHLGQDGAPTVAEMEKTLDDLATDPAVPEKKRAEIRAAQLERAIQEAAQGNSPDAWNAVEDRFTQFQKEFGIDFSLDGKTSTPVQLRQEELMILKSTGATDQLNAVVKKLAGDPQPQMEELAKKEQALIDRMAKLEKEPLDLKFTAADGTKVDVSKLRGKVILIDFWATWCAPCRADIPNVVAAYKKYHDAGFEVVGISLDQDKDTMLGVAKESGMVWPQYFDGEGFDNAISSSFGIDSIPTMWLVDQKGMVVPVPRGEDLDEAIGKLLKAS